MPHSPLPWGVNSLGEIISSDGYHVAEVIFGFDTTEDDANLIVNAVNHHEKLVNTLEQCLKLIEDEGFNTRHDTVSREAREVLASVRGQSS